MLYFQNVLYSDVLPEREQDRRRNIAEHAVGSAGLEGILPDEDDIEVLSRYIRGEATLEEVDPDLPKKIFREFV